jgi:hypothetical protein
MSNYTKTTDFAVKDTLPIGNVDKIVSGAEIDVEYNNIQTANNSKLNIANPAFTGVMTGGTIDGGTW